MCIREAAGVHFAARPSQGHPKCFLNRSQAWFEYLAYESETMVLEGRPAFAAYDARVLGKEINPDCLQARAWGSAR